MAREVSIESLARSFGSNETVFIAGSSGEPQELTQLLVDDPAVAPEARFITTFIPGINRRNLAAPDAGRRMRIFFIPPDFAQARVEGRVEFCPWSYSAIGQSLSDPATVLDTVVVQVAEPGADGQCSLGPAVEFMPTLLRRRINLCAVINSRVPDVPGSMRIAVERFALFARSDAPLALYDVGAPNDASDRIAEHLLTLIPSGATLQIGLGKVPSRLVNALKSRRDLHFHSGMLSDAILDLADAGALGGDAALTTAVALGTQPFYDRLAHVPGLRIAGVEHTHADAVLASLPNLYAINSGIEVDLLGQVNAEAVGGRYVSGPGGLPDFAHAARRSAGGLSVIALNSTDGSGRRSRIVPALPVGTPVTVPQYDVDAVVTEWGVAMLRGCDIETRARRLAGIAHPEHREDLFAHVPH